MIWNAITVTTFSYPYIPCLLLAETKHNADVECAMCQLCAYLAIVPVNRLQLQKTRNPHITATVYGLATDGLKYNFMAIVAAGNVRVSHPLGFVEENNAREIVSAAIALLE